MLGSSETRVGLLVLTALGIFLYMGFKVGAFRIGHHNYHSYTLLMKESSGIAIKSLVKIAGVKVGWVSDIRLLQKPIGDAAVELHMLISNNYSLYADASAMVRQEGMLGTHFLEIIPGNPISGSLPAGALFPTICAAPATINDLMNSSARIAQHMQGVTHTLYTALADEQGAHQLMSILENLQQASVQLAQFTLLLETSLSRNQHNVDALLQAGSQVAGVAASVQGLCSQAQESLQQVQHGKGALGKLLTDDAMYADLKTTVRHVKEYVTKAQHLEFVFDSHVETMLRRGENYQYPDNKEFFNVRIHPNQDYFYLLQVNSSERGYATRVDVQREYFNGLGQSIDPQELHQTYDTQQFFEERQSTFHRFNWRVGLQLGKIMGPVAVRAGIIENTAGIGIDLDIPLHSDMFRWVTSFEMFEITGWNRREDRRPHLKWLNSIFLFRNIYLVFGADDFISKHNGSAFIGGGIRFGDDDFKYILSTLPSNFMTGSYMIADASSSRSQ